MYNSVVDQYFRNTHVKGNQTSPCIARASKVKNIHHFADNFREELNQGNVTELKEMKRQLEDTEKKNRLLAEAAQKAKEEEEKARLEDPFITRLSQSYILFLQKIGKFLSELERVFF